MPGPTFMVIGCRKCGTTNLYRLLSAHPDVFMTTPKEPQYFSRLKDFERDRAWYTSLFAGAESHSARGEGSTMYTFPRRIELAAPRIHEAFPDCRIIYMVRHPIRRLESDWRSRLREGRARESINEAIETNDNLVTIGLYWKNLNVYRQFFSDDQILVVFLDDLAREPIPVLKRVFAHIGVSQDFVRADVRAPRNTPGRKVDNRLGSLARHIPGFDALKRLVPQSVVHAAKDVLTTERSDVADWDPAILSEVRNLYRQDTEVLLKHCGKPPDFWDLED